MKAHVQNPLTNRGRAPLIIYTPMASNTALIQSFSFHFGRTHLKIIFVRLQRLLKKRCSVALEPEVQGELGPLEKLHSPWVRHTVVCALDVQ